MNKHKLLFDVRAMSGFGGISAVVSNLFAEFQRQSKFEIIPYGHKGEILSSWKPQAIWRYIQGKLRNLVSKKIDLQSISIFFSAFYAIPNEIRAEKHIHCFQLLHDAIPVILGYKIHAWYSNLVNSLNKNTHYFCISERTKSDFLSLYGNQVDESKMHITYNAPSHPFTVLSRDNDSQKYIFAIYSRDPRKNMTFTFQCFTKFIEKHHITDLYFYLAGSMPFQIHKNIVPLGYVSEGKLNQLYSNALFFVFLSQYEGFGIPPLEAMQSGCPVISSDSSSLPEVVGSAALTVPYNDEQAVLEAFEKLYFDADLREEYRKKGLEHSKLFSWEKTIQQMSSLIESVVLNQGEK